MYHMKHSSRDGETLGTLAQMYNCPQPILEAMNPHIQNPYALAAGTMVHIPRLDKMYCHKMYLEQEAPDNVPLSQMTQMPSVGQMAQMPGMTHPEQAAPYTGTTYPMPSGQ